MLTEPSIGGLVHEPSFEGLLHLAALAVVITAGYLGIDRIRNERQTLVDELKAVEQWVRKKIEGLNLPADEHIELPKPYRIHAMYVLCYVARVRLANVPIRSRFASFFCKIYYVPLLRYFRNAFDRWVIAVLGLISILIFESLIYAGIKRYLWLADQNILELIFWVYSAIILWVFITASVAALRLRKFGQTCMELKEQLVAEIEAILAVDLKKSRENLVEVVASQPIGPHRPTTFKPD